MQPQVMAHLQDALYLRRARLRKEVVVVRPEQKKVSCLDALSAPDLAQCACFPQVESDIMAQDHRRLAFRRGGRQGTPDCPERGPRRSVVANEFAVAVVCESLCQLCPP